MTNPGGSDTPAATSLPRTTSEHFEDLEPRWAELHAAYPAATAFQHPRWLHNWLQHFGQGTTPIYLSVQVDDELVGALALDMAGASASLLGDSNVSDFAPILAAPGYEETVARGLCEWLVEDMTPAATLWGIPGDSPLSAAFEQVAPGYGWQVTTEEEAVTPVVELPGDWDAYLASLSKKDRHELRRKLRHLEAEARVSFDESTRPDDIDATFDRFLELMRKSRPDKASFLTPEREAFFRDAAHQMAELDIARLSTLRVDGETAAMTLAFESAEATYLYNSGYDPGHEGLSLGIVSKALGLRSALERGQREYNLLRGDEDYKRHLGGQARPVTRIQLRRG